MTQAQTTIRLDIPRMPNGSFTPSIMTHFEAAEFLRMASGFLLKLAESSDVKCFRQFEDAAPQYRVEDLLDYVTRQGQKLPGPKPTPKRGERK